MSSIRPLITITILVVVGAYLYVKINEGAVSPSPPTNDAWNQSPDGVPPLAAASVAPTTTEGAAPAWPPVTTPAPIATPIGSGSDELTASTDIAAVDTLPTVSGVATEVPTAVQAVPAMPEVPITAQVEPVTAPPLPTELPANIPAARYPDQTAATDTGASIDASISSSQPIGAAAAGSDTTAPISTPQELAATPEQVNAASAAASGLTNVPLTDQANPLRQLSPQSTTEIDRYAASAATTSPINVGAAMPPVEPTFAASWPAIQAALDRGELAQAHKQLSKWYGDPSLTPTDAERVESLLSQLAGTVVYSAEHQLAQAHVVKPGETLETIAKQYNVPWQLLGKINGIAAADQVRVGQELKVVPGPFSAVVDLDRNQLTLMVDGRYAGKFPVNIAQGQTVADGQWIVDQKIETPGNGNTPVSVAQFMSGNRAIVLRGESASPGAAATSTTLTIASSPSPAGTPNAGATIQVSTKDAEELSDILSVGSRVIIRR